MAGEAISRGSADALHLPKIHTARKRLPLGRALLYVIVIAASVVFMFPFVWTILSSLKTPWELRTFPPTWLPETPRLYNYVEVFERVPWGAWMWNSTIVAGLSTIGSVLSASIVAYSFARFRYPGRNLLFMITLSTMMLPVEVTLIPLYLMFSKIGWMDTYKPLIVPSFFGGGAFLIFLLRQFFLTIPLDLDEAARLDGASYMRIFWQILMPLSVPAVATAAVLTFMGQWNAFMHPFIFLNTKAKYTVAVGIRYFQAVAGSSEVMEPTEHLLMAATIMMTAPIIIMFFLAQRYLVQGIVMSGIKG